MTQAYLIDKFCDLDKDNIAFEHIIEYPALSPDLNPIEHLFAQLVKK